MIEKYPLADEKGNANGRTMFVFEKAGRYYGHIVRDRTSKEPAKLMFETGRYDSIDALKAEFPPFESGKGGAE